ncbi:hypothetical protein PT2222_460014 [Paraburkholderia tropica]
MSLPRKAGRRARSGPLGGSALMWLAKPRAKESGGTTAMQERLAASLATRVIGNPRRNSMPPRASNILTRLTATLARVDRSIHIVGLRAIRFLPDRASEAAFHLRYDIRGLAVIGGFAERHIVFSCLPILQRLPAKSAGYPTTSYRPLRPLS